MDEPSIEDFSSLMHFHLDRSEKGSERDIAAARRNASSKGTLNSGNTIHSIVQIVQPAFEAGIELALGQLKSALRATKLDKQLLRSRTESSLREFLRRLNNQMANHGVVGGSAGVNRYIEEKQNELKSFLDLHLRQFDIGFYQPPEPVWASGNIRIENNQLGSAQSAPKLPEQKIATSQNVTVEMNVTRAAIAVIPTLYPGDPASEVVVYDQAVRPLSAADLSIFNEKMDLMIGELKKSNIIAGEVRDKLISELSAGRAILNGPKPDRKLLELLLIKPLKYIGDKAASVVITALATLLLAKLSGIF